jgi:hypothetical protein
MVTPKETALRALENLRGDDLYRARAAFRNCTPDEMQQQYGQSGKTRAQIIGEYEAHEAEVNAAIAWVKSK